MKANPKSTAQAESDRRQAGRMNAPMTVVLGNTPYITEDWRLGGMRINGYYGNLRPKDRARIRVLVPTAGPGALFTTSASVRRYNRDSTELAVAFEGLDPVAISTLNRYYRERIAYGNA
jgi:hypothetical protein